MCGYFSIFRIYPCTAEWLAKDPLDQFQNIHFRFILAPGVPDLLPVPILTSCYPQITPGTKTRVLETISRFPAPLHLHSDVQLFCSSLCLDILLFLLL